MAFLTQLGTGLSQALDKLFRAPLVDERVIDDCLRQVCTALLQADVNVRLVQDLRQSVKRTVQEQLASSASAQQMNKQRLVHRVLVDHLCRLVDPFSSSTSQSSQLSQASGESATRGDNAREMFQPKHGECSVVMFVGLQGSGKTTSLSKLAAFYKRNGWRVAVVAGDTFRAGAFDQLRQNALKAGVAFYGDPGEEDPVRVCREGVDRFRRDNFELILVDTSGRHQQEQALLEEMRLVQRAIAPDQVILCMDASIGQAAEGQARAFAQSVPIGALFLTKLDSQAKGGGALTAVAACNAPIAFVGTGEHLTDLEPFVAKTFVSKLLGMGDLRGLVRAVRRLELEGDAKEQEQLSRRLQEGKFTLRDMQAQLQMVSKLGPLSHVLGMLPGFSNLPGMQGDDAQRNMKRMLIILDSMHRSELDSSDGKCFAAQPNRIVRVAKGAGCNASVVRQLLEQHKVAASVLKKLSANPAAMQQMMDPRSLARLAPFSQADNGDYGAMEDGDDGIRGSHERSDASSRPSSLVAAKRMQRQSRKK